MNFSMEWLYGTSLAIIWPASVVLLMACAAAGRAIGRWRAAKFGAAPTQSIGVLESTALGLVTLMLSFTFSAALDRYDARKALVVAEESRPGRVDPTYDTEWNTEFTLRIAPHPKLPPSHRAAIALDYGMRDGALEFKTTIYLAWYLTRRLLLDLDTDELPPERLQLQLLNRDELITAQEDARRRAAAHAAIAEQT